MFGLLSLVTQLSKLLPISKSDQTPQEVLEYGVGVPRVITSDFSSFVEKNLKDHGVHGLSLGIIKSDGSIEFGAWGDSSENGDQVNVDTQFAIGSCTKAVLSASLAILSDDYIHGRNITPLPDQLGGLDWETKIKDLLPDEWMLKDEWQQSNMNLRDILSHTSGMIGHDLSYGPHDTKEDIVKRLRLHDTPFELRQTFAYNNEMFMTGTYILEKYSGLPFSEFMRSRIFEPLGMLSTVASPDAAHMLTQAWAKSGRRIPFWFTDEETRYISGAGVLISSAKDMIKWAAMLLNEGVDPVSKTTIIPWPSFNDITSASVIVTGRAPNEYTSIIGYGLAWFRFSYKGHEVVTHHGAMPGFLSRIQLFPRDGVAVVAFTNTDGGDMVNDIVVNHAADVIFGLPDDRESMKLIEPTQHRSIQSLNKFFGVHGSVDHQWDWVQPSVPPLSLDSYAGTYSAPDYGNITFCPITVSEKSPLESSSCDMVRRDFALVDNAEGRNNTGSLQLIAAWPKAWLKQVRLVHLDRDIFSFSGVTLFTQGYGADSKPFSYESDGFSEATVRFVVSHDSLCGGTCGGRVLGFFTCGILRDAGEAQGNCLTGEGTKPGALVWFERIQ